MTVRAKWKGVRRMRTYSQNDEQRFILEAVSGVAPEHGSFLDIGAYDGETFSNTRALALLGWSGACVECSPAALEKLSALYPVGSAVIVLPFALHSEHTDHLLFHDPGGDGVGTTNPLHRALWEASARVHYREMFVGGRTWRELLTMIRRPVHVLSIDVEGANTALASICPWAELDGLRVVCVEKDNDGVVAGSRGCLMGLFGQRWTGSGVPRLVYESAENLVFSIQV